MKLVLGDFCLETDDVYDQYILFFKKFGELAVSGVENFVTSSEKCTNLSSLLRLFNGFHENAMQKTSSLACKCLFACGIYDVSEDYFQEEYADYMDFVPFFGRIGEGLAAIIDADANYENAKVIKQASRGRWVGGGFGVSGAIKGAVTAGVLNMAGSAFSGIADSLSDASHNSKIRGLEYDLFYDPNTRNAMEVALFEAILGGFWALVDELAEHGVETSLAINRDDAHTISENARKYATSQSQKSELMIKAVFLSPFDFGNFEILEKTFPELNGLMEFSETVGIRNLLGENKKINMRNRLRIIMNMPQKRTEDKNAKLVKLYIADKSKSIVISDQVEKLEAAILDDCGKSITELEAVEKYIRSQFPNAQYGKSDYYVQRLRKRITALKKDDEKRNISLISDKYPYRRKEKIIRLLEYGCTYGEKVDADIIKILNKTIQDYFNPYDFKDITLEELCDLRDSIEASHKKDFIPEAWAELNKKIAVFETGKTQHPLQQASDNDDILNDSELLSLLNDSSETSLSVEKESTRNRLSSDTDKKKVYADNLFSTKSKGLAGFIGTFLGSLGIHWFYLGKKLRGILYIALSLLLMQYSDSMFEIFIRFCVFEGVFLFCSPKKAAQRYVEKTVFSIWLYILLIAAYFSPMLLRYI